MLGDLHGVPVRDVDPELLPFRVDPQLQRDAAEERVEPVRGDPAAGLRDGAGKQGLEAGPLLGKRRLPVALDEVGEGVAETNRILEDEPRQVGARAEEAGVATMWRWTSGRSRSAVSRVPSVS